MIQTTNVLSRIINEIILLLVLVCEQHCHNRQLMCSRKAFTLDKITNLNKCNQENNTSFPPMSVNTPVSFVLNQGVDKKKAIETSQCCDVILLLNEEFYLQMRDSILSFLCNLYDCQCNIPWVTEIILSSV